jgi:5-methyltetrahydrofolate--homocysteine methyltransferase
MDCGGGFTFPANRGTIWFKETRLDFDRPPAFGFDEANPCIRQYEKLHRACLDAAEDDGFLVGQPIVLPGNDVLPLLMGPERFLTALVDHPQWMKAALAQLAEKHARVMEHFLTMNRIACRYWYGIAGWADFWAPEPFLATQSDVSCMLSPGMFAEFVLPELDLLGRRFGRLWYHLDGPDARRHLPALLSRDYIQAVQFVPGAGQPPNGPAWLDTYRQIQGAGRIVWLSLPAENIAPLLRQLDLGLVCFQTWAATEQETRDLLASM